MPWDMILLRDNTKWTPVPKQVSNSKVMHLMKKSHSPTWPCSLDCSHGNKLNKDSNARSEAAPCLLYSALSVAFFFGPFVSMSENSLCRTSTQVTKSHFNHNTGLECSGDIPQVWIRINCNTNVPIMFLIYLLLNGWICNVIWTQYFQFTEK